MNNPSEQTAVKRWGRVSLLYLALAAYFWSFSKYGLNIWDEGMVSNAHEVWGNPFPEIFPFIVLLNVENYFFQEEAGFFQILLPKNSSLPLDF